MVHSPRTTAHTTTAATLLLLKDSKGARAQYQAVLAVQSKQFPPPKTVYEYWVDAKNKKWAHWEEKLSASFRVNTEALPFYKIFVPTTDTVRYALPLTPNPTA